MNESLSSVESFVGASLQEEAESVLGQVVDSCSEDEVALFLDYLAQIVASQNTPYVTGQMALDGLAKLCDAGFSNEIGQDEIENDVFVVDSLDVEEIEEEDPNEEFLEPLENIVEESNNQSQTANKENYENENLSELRMIIQESEFLYDAFKNFPNYKWDSSMQKFLVKKNSYDTHMYSLQQKVSHAHQRATLSRNAKFLNEHIRKVSFAVGEEGEQLVIGVLKKSSEKTREDHELENTGGAGNIRTAMALRKRKKAGQQFSRYNLLWDLVDEHQTITLAISEDSIFNSCLLLNGYVCAVLGHFQEIESFTVFLVTEFSCVPSFSSEDANENGFNYDLYLDTLTFEEKLAIKEAIHFIENSLHKNEIRSSWIFMHDCWLDDEDCWDNLCSLLRNLDSNYSKSSVISNLVFSGSMIRPVEQIPYLLSSSVREQPFTDLYAQLQKLAQFLVDVVPGLLSSKLQILFIPGVGVLGPNLIPSAPLPLSLFEDFKDMLQSVDSEVKVQPVSNPCRAVHLDTSFSIVAFDCLPQYLAHIKAGNCLHSSFAKNKSQPELEEVIEALREGMTGQASMIPFLTGKFAPVVKKFEHCLNLWDDLNAVVILDGDLELASFCLDNPTQTLCGICGPFNKRFQCLEMKILLDGSVQFLNFNTGDILFSK
eukprot:GHVP01057776.1.p3 GENE.GHVP01057776.1~~GHVP01057776.1.p3  ORF type:complete len:656 (+),score=149.95 GHVP01057776.1:2886-4853(+)